MEITITINRGEAYSNDSKEGKRLKATFKKLANTAFPVGIMHGTPNAAVNDLLFTGSIEDFIEAIDHKDMWVKGGRTTEGKKTKNAKLKPIHEKSQAKCKEHMTC